MYICGVWRLNCGINLKISVFRYQFNMNLANEGFYKWGSISVAGKIKSGLTSQTNTINEAENEHSSMLIQPKMENQAENLMGSHLVNNNMDLYP